MPVGDEERDERERERDERRGEMKNEKMRRQLATIYHHEITTQRSIQHERII